jgi:hypothetical protein
VDPVQALPFSLVLLASMGLDQITPASAVVCPLSRG